MKIALPKSVFVFVFVFLWGGAVIVYFISFLLRYNWHITFFRLYSVLT